MRKLFSSVFLLSVMALAGCSKETHQQFHSFGAKGWQYQDSVSFPVTIDKPGQYTLSLLVRNDDTYPYSNLWMWASVTDPSGKKNKEHFNLPLADVTGRWLGSGPGQQYDYGLATNISLSQPGQYTITLVQDMRNNILPGIQQVGVKLRRQ